MKSFFAAAVVAFAAIGAPALAWEGQIVACYDKDLVGPKYSYSKTLIKPAKTQWEHRHGQLVEVYYPAVYKENRHLVQEQHYVVRKGACVVKK